MSMGGSSGGQQTTVSVEKPWDAAAPYLKDIYAKFAGVDQKGNPLPGGAGYLPYMWDKMTEAGQTGNPMEAFYYQGNRVAPMTADQTAAMDMTRNYATDLGSTIYPVYTPMRELLSNQNIGEIRDTWNNLVSPTISGQYLDPSKNVALQPYVQAAIDPIIANTMSNLMPTWDNQAVASGRYGSNSWQEGKSDLMSDMMSSIGNTAAGIYAPAYENERQRQQEFASYAPDLYQMLTNQQIAAAQPFQDIINQGFKQAGYLSASGEAQQAQNQALIDAAMQKFQEGIYSPLDWSNAVANLYMSGGALGRTQQTTSPYTGPGLAQSILGTGSSLAGLLNSIGAF